MGCDIHLYVEKLDPKTKEWEFVRAPEDARWGEWYSDRNYNLFAMLADVRNGSGFAGVDTGDRITPISAPRGIPEDASARYKRIAGPFVPCHDAYRETWECAEGCDGDHGWGVDGHSHSWLTARELHEVDWDQPITHRGVVTPTQYRVFKEKGAPDGWSGGVWGAAIQYVSNDEMETLISTGAVKADDGARWGGSTHYTQVEWTTTWREAAGESWFAFVDRLNKLTLDDGRDVRIVFFFDN